MDYKYILYIPSEKYENFPSLFPVYTCYNIMLYFSYRLSLLCLKSVKIF